MGLSETRRVEQGAILRHSPPQPYRLPSISVALRGSYEPDMGADFCEGGRQRYRGTYPRAPMCRVSAAPEPPRGLPCAPVRDPQIGYVRVAQKVPRLDGFLLVVCRLCADS